MPAGSPKTPSIAKPSLEGAALRIAGAGVRSGCNQEDESGGRREGMEWGTCSDRREIYGFAINHLCMGHYHGMLIVSVTVRRITAPAQGLGKVVIRVYRHLI